SQITKKSKNGLGFQSYSAVPPPATLVYNTGRCAPPKTDLSYSSLEEFKQHEFESYGPKSCEIESKNSSEDIPNELKEYPDAPLVKDMVSDNKDCSVESLVVVEKKTVVPTIAKVEVVRPKQQENQLAAITIKGKGWSMIPRAVLIKTSLKPLNIVRPVNTAHPKTTVHSAKPMPRFSKIAPSTGHPQKVQEDQGYVDSGCSRHMTWNMSYFLDFKEFNGGYVTFGRGANGDRITDCYVRTIDNGEHEIIAIVDGKEFIVTEASVRRHLQLADADGISVLPNTKFFNQLSMMGYVLTEDKLTFQKGKFSPHWRFLIHTILHCLSPKKTSWEQFSSNIATAITSQEPYSPPWPPSLQNYLLVTPFQPWPPNTHSTSSWLILAFLTHPTSISYLPQLARTLIKPLDAKKT
nr:hypothetical protein [Tanacetum cinerariifolium]